MINYKIISHIVGILLVFESAFMISCAPVSHFMGYDDAFYFIISAVITFVTGGLLWFLTRNYSSNMGKREGYIIVSISWVIFSFFGSLPFYLSESIPSYTDAFFETISGFTTTGASILNNIEELSSGMLFWRSMIQWLGGMGIIVLSLSILPFLGIGGMQLFIAEVPGPTPDKLHPRIMETARRLWAIYIIFTAAEVVLLLFGGMSLFDAVCHSFTTMATGGYSTKQASIAYFESPYIQYVITFFMFLAGVNFTLSYHAMHLRLKPVWRNEEFRYYFGVIIIFSLVIGIGLFFSEQIGLEKAFRDGLFQVVSIVTTTGFATADYISWMPLLSILILVLMFVGGSAGSTGGGIKVVRNVLMFKNTVLELKRLIHPNAVIPVRIDKQAVPSENISNVLAFISFYLLIFFFSSIVVALMGYDIESSVGAVAATLGNIGPGFGAVGPVENYSHFPAIGKWFLSFLMLIGRLELFTVLILFSPAFWKK
jgi:trk system potassium uptake protein TrkH